MTKSAPRFESTTTYEEKTVQEPVQKPKEPMKKSSSGYLLDQEVGVDTNVRDDAVSDLVWQQLQNAKREYYLEKVSFQNNVSNENKNKKNEI